MEVLLFSVPLIFRLVYDWDKIRKDKETISRPGYFKRNLWLLGMIIVTGTIGHLLWPEPPLLVNYTYPLGIFILLFDYAINLLSGKKWYYRSQTGISRWEKFRNKIPIAAEPFIRAWVAACLISIYYQYQLL